jgi:pilus assembly protein Flp/PilA
LLSNVRHQDFAQSSDLDIEPGTEDCKWRLTMTFINKLFRDEAGATAIEYGLIAALIAVAAITAMGALGNQLTDTFEDVSTNMAS